MLNRKVKRCTTEREGLLDTKLYGFQKRQKYAVGNIIRSNIRQISKSNISKTAVIFQKW